MPRVIFSSRALRDIHRCYHFLADKNAEAAKRAVKAIREGVNVLGLQPHIGRAVDDMPDDIREWLIEFGDSGYVARYRFDGGELVTILAVWHQREAGM